MLANTKDFQSGKYVRASSLIWRKYEYGVDR
jgi:hypothetical protein